jgi:hypothetical protein
VTYDGSMATGAVAANVDPRWPERQVGFALAITDSAVLAVYRPLLEPLGLTPPQYLVILHALGASAIEAGALVGETDSGTAANGFGEFVAVAQTARAARVDRYLLAREVSYTNG